ncbi:hypothetical protein ACA910_003761 [Epithemia clementina (nom. ined.)]
MQQLTAYKKPLQVKSRGRASNNDEALSNTQTFVCNLVPFIDKTMEDLVGNSDFNERKAWSLTTQIAARLFSDRHEVRCTISTLLKPDNLDSICAWVLWGVFKTQDVMQEYMEA